MFEQIHGPTCTCMSRLTTYTHYDEPCLSHMNGKCLRETCLILVCECMCVMFVGVMCVCVMCVRETPSHTYIHIYLIHINTHMVMRHVCERDMPHNHVCV